MTENGREKYREIVLNGCQEDSVLQVWLQAQSEAVVHTAELCAGALKQGNRILICGNGGSAADAQHLATELVVRLSGDFDRPALPAMALTVDSSTLTAAANDFGYNQVFARQVEAHGRPGDILLAISTSGNSANVIQAVQTAHLGNNGGKLKDSRHCFIVPSEDTNRIQEIHITLGHLLVKIVERILYG